MLRLLLLTLAVVCSACDETGRWPGGGGGSGGGDGDGDSGDGDSGGGGGGGGGGAENILVNGGFERLDQAGDFAARWTSIDDNPDGDIRLVEEPVRVGQRAVEWQIAAEDGWEYWIQQSGIDPALLEPGERYEIAGWFRSSEIEGDISFSYIVRGDDGGELNITNDWDNTHPSRRDTWERFGWQFTIPDDADPSNYAVMLHLIKWTGAELRFQIDDVTLLPAM